MVFYVSLFLLAFVYTNLLEWLIHKYVFHGMGKKRKSLFSTHWHIHHRGCRKNQGHDHTYKEFPPHDTVRHEILSLVALCIIHLPVLWLSSFFYGCLVFFSCRYFYLHRKSHMDVEWARKHLPWHYEHHMGRNQDANWGVTNPLWDHIMGTRIKCLTTNIPPKATNSNSET